MPGLIKHGILAIMSNYNSVPGKVASKFICLILVSISFPSPWSVASEESVEKKTSITLEKAITLGIEGASKVLKASSADEAAGIQVLQSYARLWPNLNFTTGYTFFNGNSISAVTALNKIDATSSLMNYSVSSSLNLFNGYADKNSIQLAIARKKASALTVARARQNIAIDIEQSFLQVILDQRIEEIAKNNLRVSTDILNLIEAQKKLGSAILSDLYRQIAQVEADKLALMQAADKVKVDRLLLLQKLRMDMSTEYELTEPDLPLPNPNTSVPQLENLLKTAYSQRKDLQALQAVHLGSQFEVNVAQGTRLPRLDFTLTYGGFGLFIDRQTTNGQVVGSGFSQQSIEDQLKSQRTFTVGLVMTWPIYDRGVTNSNIQLARINEQNARIDKLDAKNQITVDVKQALMEYGTALKSLESSSAGLEAAQKAFEVIQERYKLGLTTFIDLSVAQRSLAQAKAARAQAIIGYRLKKDVLAFVSGMSETP